MATVHIKEIQKYLEGKALMDAQTNIENGEGYFVEIRFDNPVDVPSVIDEELKNKVITADCPYGTVTIIFDDYGQLRSLDLS